MANTIKIKRGLSSNIDNATLAQGELAITTDTNELYVGKESGKEKINVQANYNQNDEKAADYIKNRAIYEDGRVIYNGKITFSNEGLAIINVSRALSNMLSSTPFLNEKGEFILEMIVSIGGQEISLYSDRIGIQKYGNRDELYNEYICGVRNFRMSIIYDKNLLQFTQIHIFNPETTAEVEVDCNIKIGVVSNVIKNWIISYNMPN